MACVENGDGPGFYTSIFMFAEAGLDSAKNKVLSQLLHELLPTVRRLQYLTIKMKTGNLKQTTTYFKTIMDCLETRDVNRGEKAIKDYVRSEKEFGLEAMKSPEFRALIAG